MKNSAPFSPPREEGRLSQISALKLLPNLGYAFVTPERAQRARGARVSELLLEGAPKEQLAAPKQQKTGLMQKLLTGEVRGTGMTGGKTGE